MISAKHSHMSISTWITGIVLTSFYYVQLNKLYNGTLIEEGGKEHCPGFLGDKIILKDVLILHNSYLVGLSAAQS